MVVNERIEVVAKFSQGKVVPMSFIWKGKDYLIRRTTLVFDRKDGGRNFKCFAVELDGMVAELALDRTDLTWRLVSCSPVYA